jgi:hypothetical protein
MCSSLHVICRSMIRHFLAGWLRGKKSVFPSPVQGINLLDLFISHIFVIFCLPLHLNPFCLLSTYFILFYIILVYFFYFHTLFSECDITCRFLILLSSYSGYLDWALSFSWDFQWSEPDHKRFLPHPLQFSIYIILLQSESGFVCSEGGIYESLNPVFSRLHSTWHVCSKFHHEVSYCYKTIILLRVELLLCNDREIEDVPGPFLGNGSLNTFPRQRVRIRQRNGVFFYVVSAAML